MVAIKAAPNIQAIELRESKMKNSWIKKIFFVFVFKKDMILSVLRSHLK